MVPTAEQVVRDILGKQGTSEADIERWLDAPNEAFDGKSPRQMFEEGKGRTVVDRLVQLAQGNVGS